MSSANQNPPDNPCLQLINHLWRDPKKYHFLAVQDPEAHLFKSIPVAPTDDIGKILSEVSKRPTNVFFACGEYSTSDARKGDNVSQLFVFFVDLDVGEAKAEKGVGYSTLDDARAALDTFCTNACLPSPTAIVASGGGIHAYWILDQAVDRDVWKKYGQKFKAISKALGFMADPTRTADAASVLRLPATLNHKYAPPRPVTLEHMASAYIPRDDFLAAIELAHDMHVNAPQAPHGVPVEKRPAATNSGELKTPLAELSALLERINPDISYQTWTMVGMALFYECDGAPEALELYDSWSKRGTKYKSRAEIMTKWRSFRNDIATPVTVRSLRKLAREAEMAEDFTFCKTEVIYPDSSKVEVSNQGRPKPRSRHPLERYSLLGHSDELARSLRDEVHILDNIAISGQATMIFAAPNSGKTLLAIYLLTRAIDKKRIDPNLVYYINVDDTQRGLFEKVRIAEDYGFHMLGEGHRNFSANQFLDLLAEMTSSGTANGTVIVLDTVKRFTDMMDKTRNTHFTAIVRSFVTKGGTVIGLGHVNKNPGRDGRPVHSGTSDLVDDFDCAHILAEVERLPESNEKVVAFSCIKRRGNVASEIAFRYTMHENLTYGELLLSVMKVDEDDLISIRSVVEERTDAEMIDAVRTCITEGINTKMQLVKSVCERTKASHKAVIRVIEKYTGGDPEMHHWFFEVRARGAKCFVLHKP